MLYKNLVEIGLEQYLNAYFFGKEWVAEVYLQKQDNFVGSKNASQKDVFRKKFQELTDHISINDHIYELMIGAVFHPCGEFQYSNQTKMQPDIIDGDLRIEVKNINAEPEEIERIKTIVPDAISYGPFPDDKNFDIRFRKKFAYRVDKAKKQISNYGIIYIIWDTTVKGSTKRKPKIESLLNELITREEKDSPNVQIKAIDFEELRNMVTRL